MRASGASMAEIERAVGVPASTLYQWAARGSWRWRDLEGEVSADRSAPCDPDSLLSSGPSGPSGVTISPSDGINRSRPSLSMTTAETSKPGSPTPQASDSFLSSPTSVGSVLAPGGTSPPSLRAGGRPCDAFGVGELDSAPSPPATPASLREAGAQAMCRALDLAQEGKARAAREALLLGQRFVRAAEVLDAAQRASGLALEDEADEDASGEQAKAELAARFERLFDYHSGRSVRAAEQIGLTEIGIAFTGPLDLSAFEVDGQGYRRATEAELDRIKAGDWPVHETVPEGRYSPAERIAVAHVMALPEATRRAIAEEVMAMASED